MKAPKGCGIPAVPASARRDGQLTSSIRSCLADHVPPPPELNHRVLPDLGPVYHVSVTHGASWVAVGTYGLVLLWDPHTGTQRYLEEHTGKVKATCFRNHGGQLLSADESGMVCFWDVPEARLQRCIDVRFSVLSLHASPDGQLIALGGATGEAKVLDAETLETVFSRQHGFAVRDVRLHRGETLLQLAGDWVTEVWALPSGQLRRRYGLRPQDIGEMQDSTATELLCAAGGRFGIVLDTWSGDIVMRVDHAEPVTAVDILPDASGFVTASTDGTSALFDRQTRRARIFHHRDSVNAVCAVPGRNRVVTGCEDRGVRVWSPAGLERELLPRHTSAISGAVVDDGRRLLVGTYDGLYAYDLETLERQPNPRFDGIWTSSIAVSPSGDRIATGSRHHDGWLWRPRRPCDPPDPMSTEEIGIYAVAFSPDGRTFYTGSLDGTLRMWEMRPEVGPVCRGAISTHQGWLRHIAVSPNGTRIAISGDDGSVHIRDDSFAPVGECHHGGCVYASAFTPDGEGLVTVSGDGLVRLFRLEGKQQVWQTGTPERVFKGHLGAVRCLAILGDNQVATGGFDGTVRLWDLEKDYFPEVLNGGHHSWVRFIVATPERLYSGGKDGLACVWSREKGTLLGRLHLLREGVLWTTTPDEEAGAGWFWTDRPDRIEVSAEQPGVGDRVLPEQDPTRADYLLARNSREEVLSRLNPDRTDAAEGRRRHLARLRRAVADETRRMLPHAAE